MNYGLWLSAGGVLSNLHRQDVLANNLSNVQTVGFKPDLVATRQRGPERLESPGAVTDPQWLLEQLGGGHFVNRSHTTFGQGGLDRTGNPLDLAIEGDALFVVAPPGRSDAASIRLTRDGRLTLSSSGDLVMAATGLRVLDADGRGIRVRPDQPVEVDRDGTIRQADRVVARLQLVSADPAQLVKAGANLFRPEAGAAPLPATTGSVRQGFVESSAVDPIDTLNDLIAATKAAQANAKLMQYHDFIMGQAVGTLGRVS